MTRTGFALSGRITVVFALLACTILITAPVSAVTKYLGGAPSFSAEVTGVNEFTPGEDATISILVKNSGIFTAEQLDRGTIAPEDLPNTAKTTTVGLSSPDAAVIIRTDPQMVGDIYGNGNTIAVQFKAKISMNASSGEYQLPLIIRYQYPLAVEQEKADVYQFVYNQSEDILPVTIRIKPQVRPDVVEVTTEQLSVGSQGYLDLTIRNTGRENAERATVKLLRNGKSPVIPTENSLFVGSFPSGGIVECRFKVSIAKDAANQTYPVDVAVVYTNRDGTIVTSPLTTAGVPVNAKTAFSVISPAPEVPTGTSSIIEVQYRNDGSAPVYDAQVRIVSHDPVTMSDNTAFLGDLEPGSTARARYEVLADTAAEPAMYSFDSTVRYRDAQGDSHESDPAIVTIKILPAKTGTVAGLSPMVVIPAGILLIIVVIIGLRTYRDRKRLQ